MKLKEDQGEVRECVRAVVVVVVVAAAAAVGTKAVVGGETIGDAAAAVEERKDSGDKVKGIKKGRGRGMTL